MLLSIHILLIKVYCTAILQITCILLTNISPLFTRLINITFFISLSPHNIAKFIFIPIHSIRIHKVHRIIITERIRRYTVVLLRERILGKPSSDNRVVLTGAVVDVTDCPSLPPAAASFATNIPPAKPALSNSMAFPVFLYIKELRYKSPSPSLSSALTFVPSAR